MMANGPMSHMVKYHRILTPLLVIMAAVSLFAAGNGALAIVGSDPVLQVGTSDSYATLPPNIRTATQICAAPATKHYHVVSQVNQWQAVLEEPVKDSNGVQIKDPTGAPILTKWRAIITSGPDGMSADVALFHSTTGALENPSSEPNTPAVTACIQKGAVDTRATP